jgi:hypothetical protein
MLIRVAKLLLNEIKKNAPESRIKRIARLLFRIAAADLYTQIVRDNFVSMFNTVILEEDLVKWIKLYHKKLPLIAKVTEINKLGNADPARIARIRELLKTLDVSEETLSKLADDLIEENMIVKKSGPIQSIINAYKYNNNVKVETPMGEYSFKFIGSDHFSHRRYLRGFTDGELNATLKEFAYVISTQQFRISKNIKNQYTSHVKRTDTDMPISIVFTPEIVPSGTSKEYEVKLVTAFPARDRKNTLREIKKDIEGFNEKKEKEVESQLEIKAPSTSTSTIPISMIQVQRTRPRKY